MCEVNAYKHETRRPDTSIKSQSSVTRRKGLTMAEKKRVVAQNRKAYHDYFVEDTYEAGIELFGTEVKSIRQGKVNLKDCYCVVEDGEMYVLGMHISPYEQGNIFNRDPLRKKRLLMHKREIIRLYAQVRQEGFTLVALSVYFLGSKVKIEIGVCKGKKLYDKRESIAERDAKREIDRVVKERNRIF